MRQMQRVLWTKGVLLSPQHLQSQDRFLEELIDFQLASLTFHPWGFSRLQIDREALAGGSLAITEAAGIFPDGLPFEIPESDAAPAPRPIQESWPPDARSLDIHLAIPEHRIGGHNISRAQNGGNTRYMAEMVLRRDENTGLAEKPIQVARKNLRLLAQGETLEGSTVLHVARVLRTPTGGFHLDPHFVPPLVNITASEYLLNMSRRLVEILSAKSNTLSAMRRERNQSLADFGSSDVANFWLLYTVNTHLPRFRHLFETRRGHPGELFSAMLALAGTLTTFATALHPRELPAYDHSQLGTCFTSLDEIVRKLLETTVPANHVVLPLVQTDDPSIYATAIDQDQYLTAPQLYLALSADLKPDELVRTALGALKISSNDQIERLHRQAISGVGLQHVSTLPSAVPIKRNHQYFTIDRSGPWWDAVRAARNLAVYVPSGFPTPQLELLVLLPKTPGSGG
jgi:type VI secretion system protein ImpJ